ncbi:hypothetical protein FX985_00948 [Pseudomonas extremaustralis]|uniref:Uncharacterized protein n=1 Tax=Pseudomonas extremaustralis TaxID=359110 RepID=A0A5M9IVT6_9PSED|nr:hypothetical protein [Pseudomonas extremaustralis]KAA8560898.1 hypothetical protein FX985_00948 [Pseudomonas extremaustralis]
MQVKLNVLGLWVAGLLSGLSGPAMAATVDILASFRPDPSQPARNVFKNETPPGNSYCGWAPQYCSEARYSIGLPIKFNMASAIQPGGDDRQHILFHAPTDRRNITVVHDETGETETLRLRISGIGMAMRWTLPDMVWEPSPVPPAPCRSSGVAVGGVGFYGFTWLLPEGVRGCGMRSTSLMPAGKLWFDGFGFTYELVTPNPLGMRAGIYRGQQAFSVGPYKDFDMGDVMLPNDDQITLNFILSVDHILKVEIPPGGDRIELLPQGGWQGWVNQGRKPTRLFRDQTFNFHSTSRFKMGLECQYFEAGDNTCRIRDAASGRSVPLQVGVTMPHGIVDAVGQPINRRPLRLDGTGTQLLLSTMFVNRKPGTLHFEVARDDVEKMLHPNEANTYEGRVTVIWDSEV